MTSSVQSAEAPGLHPTSTYQHISYWLESSGDDLTPRPSLETSLDVDIAILGAGYTGLWAAYYLRQRDPSLKIAILESEISGFGASGRNGGWVSSGFPVSPKMLLKRFGPEYARSLLEAVIGSIDEIGTVISREKIDAEFHRGGALRIARGTHQLTALQAAIEGYRSVGLGDRYESLSAEEVRQRVTVNGAVGGLFTSDCALVHPGKLVRGLARAVERSGTSVYERTPVSAYVGGSYPKFVTPRGELTAGVLVLAAEAYLSRLPPLHRHVLPVQSLICLTEPLSSDQLDSIGWKGRECLSSTRYTVDYLSQTSDGRILFGSRGSPYRFGSRLDQRSGREEPTFSTIRGLSSSWFPSLHDLHFTHSWGGPVGMPRDWMPTATYEPQSGVAMAGGYTGQGVATSNLAGRILADLISGHKSDLTRLPIANHVSPKWEPEPFRWLAVRYIQRTLERLDLAGERTGRVPTGRSLAERLSRH